MKDVADRIQRIVEWIMAGTLAVMVVMVFGNAAARYLLERGIVASEELSRLAFVWLVFLGAAVAVRDRSHVGTDMLVLMLPRLGKRICLIICNGLILYGLWLFADGAWQQTIIGMDNQMPVTGLPVAVFTVAGLVSAAAMGVLFVIDLVRALIGDISDQEMVQVRDSTDQEEVAETLRDLPAPDHR